MKLLTSIITISALMISSLSLPAQNDAVYLTVTMLENSNMHGQVPAPVVICLNNFGDDTKTAMDTGDIATVQISYLQVYPFTLSSDNYVITAVDDRPALNGYKSIPFGFLSPASTQIKVTASISFADAHAHLPGYVWLEQISTGEKHSLLDTTADFNIVQNQTGVSDFILHIGPSTGSVATDANCMGNSFGTILVKGPGAPGFSYVLKKDTTLVYNGFITGYDTLLQNVTQGSYTGMITWNGMMLDSSNFMIAAPASVVADFTTDFTSYTTGDAVNISDASVGGAYYEWRFGDGDSSMTSGNQLHVYTIPGDYTITLMLTDTAGCMSMHSELIVVDSAITAIHPYQYTNLPDRSSIEQNNTSSNTSRQGHCSGLDGRIVVNLGQSVAKVTIMSINGGLISSTVQIEMAEQYQIPAPGVYMVNIEFADGTVSNETVFVQQ